MFFHLLTVATLSFYYTKFFADKEYFFKIYGFFIYFSKSFPISRLFYFNIYGLPPLPPQQI